MSEHPNVHDLINLPGYGKANEKVKDAGFWDHMAASSPDDKEFKMDVQGTFYGVLTVLAPSLDDAMDKAFYARAMTTSLEIRRIEIDSTEEHQE